MFSISLSRFSNNRKKMNAFTFWTSEHGVLCQYSKCTKSEQCLITMTDLFLSYENTPFAGENISKKDNRYIKKLKQIVLSIYAEQKFPSSIWCDLFSSINGPAHEILVFISICTKTIYTETSSITLLCVCEKLMLWRDCAYA